MTKYKIKFSTIARDDLKELGYYIKEQLTEPITAKIYITSMKNEIKNLEYFPMKYPQILEKGIKHSNTRKLIFKNFIIVYSIYEDKNIVIIDRILYSGSNWQTLLH